MLHFPPGGRLLALRPYEFGDLGKAEATYALAWSLSRTRRNRAAHALHGNGRPRRQRAQASQPFSTSTTTSVLSAAQQRAKVASRAALPTELAAVGFSLSPSLPLRPQELLHLHRRRLTSEERRHVLHATGASHIVGDDALCPATGRAGVGLADLWKIAPSFAWGNDSLPAPLIAFPDHLVRLRERVAWELQHNPAVQKVVVLLSVPRATLDRSTSWATFVQEVDPALLQGWGSGLGYPLGTIVVPPLMWETAPLPCKFAAVALKVGRRTAGDLEEPTFQKLGSFPSWAELKMKDREGLTRIAVEIDINQRPRVGRLDVRAYGRRALVDLLACCANVPAGLPMLFLQGVAQRGDMLCGFVDLPSILAADLVRCSGAVRGVFARPWLGAEASYPLPPGFSTSSHRIIWTKVARFSDVVFQHLRQAGVAFDGMVCPRSRGEMGVRVAATADLTSLRRCLEDDCDARVKLPHLGIRTHVRASGVPVALLCSLPTVARALNSALVVVSQRIVRTTYDSLVADLLLEGPALVGDEWSLTGLGTRPVVVKRLPSRRTTPSAAAVVLAPVARVPAPRRPLSAGEISSWANVVRKGQCAAPTVDVPFPMEVSSSAEPTAYTTITLSPDVAAHVACVADPLIPEDAKIPMRPRSSKAKGKPAAVAPTNSASKGPVPSLASASSSRGQRNIPVSQRGIPAFFSKPVVKAVASSCSSMAHVSTSSASSSSASSASAVAVGDVPSLGNVASSIAEPRMTSLEAQVGALSAQLEEQVKLNRQLQKQLSQVLRQCAELTLSLRVLKSKRSHSASASTTATPERASAGDVPMSPSGAPSGPARRLAVGGQPLDDGYF